MRVRPCPGRPQRISVTYLADAEPEVVVEGSGGEQHLREAGGRSDGALV